MRVAVRTEARGDVPDEGAIDNDPVRVAAAETVTLAGQVFVPEPFCTVRVQVWVSVIEPVVKMPPVPVNAPEPRFPEHV